MDYIEKVIPAMERAARQVSKRWPQATTEDDLYHDLVVHFLEAPGSLEKLAELSDEARIKRLVAIGNEKASAARDAFEHFSGQYSYGVAEVRSLLAKGALTEMVPSHYASSCDVQVAMEQLARKNQRYWKILRSAYIDGAKFDRQSNEASNVLPRAHTLLTTLMNRNSSSKRYDYENGGGRSNSENRRRAVADYEGW
jgi:hypothetical protein